MKSIALTKGLEAIVSTEDFDFLSQFKWCASHESRRTKFYAIRRPTLEGKRVKVRMHRVVVERVHGPIPEGKVVDHINDNSLDNRRENLQIVTQSENMFKVPNWRKRSELPDF